MLRLIHFNERDPWRTMSWWRIEMETISALLALCAGNSLVTIEFPIQRPVTFSLICGWINDWASNREAGDLRRHRGHYDVTVMVNAVTVVTLAPCAKNILTVQDELLLALSNESLQWRHDGYAGVSNHQPHDCLLNRLFRHRSKKTSKLRVTGLCEGNSPVTGEFPAQKASNAENVSIWWRHNVKPASRVISVCVNDKNNITVLCLPSTTQYVMCYVLLDCCNWWDMFGYDHHGPPARYVKLWVALAPRMTGTFSLPPRVSDSGMHHGTIVTHVPWCMPGSIYSGFLWRLWRGKRFRHSRRMRNLQFCVSDKKPIGLTWWCIHLVTQNTTKLYFM